MQIFLGACLFFVAVAMLAYVPGKLLLILLKRTLSSVGDFTLACVLGLVVSALTYWLMGLAHQAHVYVLWPLATTGFFFYLHAGKWKSVFGPFEKVTPHNKETVRPSRDRSGLALAGVVALGVAVLAILPQHYTNLTRRADGTMRVHPIPDVFFHIAIANELTHTIPPQAPMFSGHPLTYHYGMDLAVAMFANATGLNTRDLTLRFVPTLFLALSMLSVFCFSRTWLGSGYFAVLAVFLVFFGEDFSFIPGLLQGKGDWSVRYFRVPTVFSLFYTNPILPGVGLLFAGLFCLQCYLRERGTPWLFLSALFFVALMEVKVFAAVQIMCSLGLAAIVYLLVFRNAALLKVAASTAALATPLVLSLFLHNKSGADIATTFDPGVCVSNMVNMLGMKERFAGVVAFIGIALPIYLVGCLGLRVIAVPAILTAVFRPGKKSGLRFVLALFVVIGLLITLTCRIVPAGWTNAYNNGVWFLVQSKYVLWIFTVEALQRLYRHVVAGGARPSLAAAGITASAVVLSVPATVQHFARESDPYRAYGKPLGKEFQSYSPETLSVIDFLTKDAQSGDVVLAGGNLLDPVLALTKCRVPLGYFSNAIVALRDYSQRETAEKEFWKAWRLGNVQGEFLREAGVRYVTVSKRTEGVPPKIPSALSEVFGNSEFAVFKVCRESLSEAAPKP